MGLCRCVMRNSFLREASIASKARGEISSLQRIAPRPRRCRVFSFLPHSTLICRALIFTLSHQSWCGRSVALAAQHGDADYRGLLPWCPLPPEALLYACTTLPWCSGWGTAVLFSLMLGCVHLTHWFSSLGLMNESCRL